jgi:hypothetical protein
MVAVRFIGGGDGESTGCPIEETCSGTPSVLGDVGALEEGCNKSPLPFLVRTKMNYPDVAA